MFCTRGVRDFGTSKLVGKSGEHIKLDVVDDTSGKVYSGIAFNSVAHFDHIHSGKPFDICYTIEDNRRKGTRSIQLMVKDISTGR